MKKISIIIPIYNTALYLNKCLDSIINQTYKNIEIILINDGSKDNSLKICQEYTFRDNRIILINKQNAGVSQARNDGIKIASGDYIMFVDSDDWLELNTIEICVNEIKNYDLLLFPYIREFKDRSIPRKLYKMEFSINNYEQIFNQIFCKT